MAPEYFRNTGLGDILEYAGVWKFPSNFKVQLPGESVGIALDKEVSEYEAHVAHEMTQEREEASGSPLNEDIDPIEKGNANNEVDPFLVDWNGSNDPENPQNWPTKTKGSQLAQIFLITCVVYAGSSIYTAGQEAFQQHVHVGHVAATLPLSIYVLGYGIGPLIFAPLSETASVGRNHIYLITLFFFTIFQIGCALVNNLGGMVVLRFIAGVLCSPSLSVGGASMGDILNPQVLTLAIGAWAAGTVAAPALAPLLGAAMLVAKGWRWIFWFLMIWAAFTFLLMFFTFYESLGSNILHRRAQRVRKETGDKRYYTMQERIDENIEYKAFVKELLLRPMIIQFSEPGVLAFNLYTALGYGSFYLFFEAFPLVFVGIYHFTPVEVGLAFMGFQVGFVFAYLLLVVFLMTVIAPAFKNNTFTPETFLKLPMMVSWLLPFSLFFFGWTAQIHWILPIVSEIFFLVSIYNIFQGALAYLSLSYPRYIASVFASNSLMRSGFAFSFPLFGQAMFKNTGSKKYPVGWGSSIVGFATLVLAMLPFIFYYKGAALRGRSKYAN